MPHLTSIHKPISSLLQKAAFLALFIPISSYAASQATVTAAPTSKNFGQVVANGPSPATLVLSYSITGVTAPTFSLKYGTEYKAAAPSCSGSGNVSCTVAISFLPRLAGLRQDAVLVGDNSGNLISTTLLYGIGLAPQISIYPGVISTAAGKGSWGYFGDNGPATAATFRNPQGLAIDGYGNLYITDSVNQIVREVSATSGIISTIAGNGLGGYWGDGGKATQAGLNNPAGIAVDGAGNVYIADQGNNLIRRVDAKTQQISTVAGGGGASGPDGLGDGGLATNALLSGPNDIAVDGAGNLFIADSWHGLIRKVDALTGIISVVAGGGNSAGGDGFGDNGPAVKASLQNPSGVALDASGNLYIADTGHSVVRRLDAISGTITLVAGNGRSAYSGDSGPASSASLGSPYGIRVDAASNVYIADQATSVIREVNAVTGIITTIAGTGAQRYAGDGGVPTSAALANPTGIVLDAIGNIIVADFSNNVIRKITLNTVPLTFTATLVGEISDFKTVKVLNTGNQPLGFAGLTLSSNFKQQSLGSIDCLGASVMPAGGTCSVGIRFAPGSAGTLTGALALTDNAMNVPGSVQTTVLSGIATANTAVPQLSFAPGSLAFGTQGVGSASSPQLVTLSNPGTGPLNLSSIQVGGLNASDFILGSDCQSILAGGAHCSVSLVFSPIASGARTASLIFVDNLASSPQMFSMTGTAGQPQVALGATSLVFGNQPVGSSSPAQTLGISSTGSAPLNISAIAVAGANAADFSLSSSCGNTVAPGANCSVAITFSPHAAGLRTASFSLADNATGTNQIVNLSGRASLQMQPAVWRPSNGTWYFLQGTNTNPVATQWGLPGDIPVPGDYDGDGKTDFAVFRPSNGIWYIVQSSNGNVLTKGWGGAGDIPVPGDYDGDGKTDIAVFHPSNGTWYIIQSSTGAGLAKGWGGSGDIPVPGDYDGDGKTDIAVFHPSNGTWCIIQSGTGAGFTKGWGGSGDIPVPGDYDGDGKTDIAVFHPSNGTWYFIQSSTGAGFAKGWGGSGDIPVPGDYDGDGKTDIAVFHPSNGSWSIIQSKSWAGVGLQLGAPGDIPTVPFSRP